MTNETSQQKSNNFYVRAANQITYTLITEAPSGYGLLAFVPVGSDIHESIYSLSFEKTDAYFEMMKADSPSSAPTLSHFIAYLADQLITSEDDTKRNNPPMSLMLASYEINVDMLLGNFKFENPTTVSQWDIVDGFLKTTSKRELGSTIKSEPFVINDAAQEVFPNDENDGSEDTESQQDFEKRIAETFTKVAGLIGFIALQKPEDGMHVLNVASQIGNSESIYGKINNQIRDNGSIKETVDLIAHAIIRRSWVLIILHSYLGENPTMDNDSLFMDSSPQTIRGWMLTDDTLMPLSSEQIIDISCYNPISNEYSDPQPNVAYLDGWDIND